MNETKDLASEGLAQLLQITTGFQIEYAPIGSFVTLYPPGHSSGNAPNDSMYVDFSLQFNLEWYREYGCIYRFCRIICSKT